MTEYRVPDYIGKLMAYRSWRLSSGTFREDTRLQSYSHQTVWEPGKPISAFCHQTKVINCPRCGHSHKMHEPPQLGCSCGIYCFKDPVAYMRQIPRLNPMQARNEVHGVIRIWGRAIEHRDGYRAEHAEIVLLCTMDTQLCELYGAEQFRGTFHEMIKEMMP